jgi:type VI secretion system protein
MKLYLSITSAEANPGFASSITLDHEGATIGRLSDNTLVLPDPKKYISGHHAQIQYRAPHYFIIDTSTNGVLINLSPAPLGNGNSAMLNDGDRVQIGDYTISVKLLGSSPEASPFDKREFSADDFEAKSFDFSDDPFAEIGVDAIQQTIEDNELIPSDWKDRHDPFDLPLFQDAAVGEQETGRPDPQAFEQVPAFKEAFQPFSGHAEEPQSEAATAPASTASASDIFGADWFSGPGKNKAAGGALSKSSPFADFPVPSPEEPDEKTSPPQIPTPKTTRTPPVFEPEPEPAPVFEKTPPAPLPETEKPAPADDLKDELIRSFLRGAGLEDSLNPTALTPESFQTIGKIVRESLQGTLDVLVGRAKIKNEMHLDVTTIRARQNNPIKFSVSAEEAMIKLLTVQDKAYLQPDAAIKEVFDDIRAHQFAVIAGMRTALLSVLQRFDPKKLEQRLQATSPIAASIPFHKQAKLWSLFEQLYSDLGREAEDNFYHLFGQAFAETYEQQLRKIKSSSHDQTPY